jgi:hypothetical protein
MSPLDGTSGYELDLFHREDAPDLSDLLQLLICKLPTFEGTCLSALMPKIEPAILVRFTQTKKDSQLGYWNSLMFRASSENHIGVMCR